MTDPGFRGEPAGVVTRLLACLVDTLVTVTILAMVWIGASAALFLASPARFTWPSPSWVFTTVTAVACATLYLTFCWATSGRTLGAQLLGLRVVRGTRQRLGWGRAGLRAVLYVLFPAGLLWTAVDARRRSLQDLVVGSTVVYDWRPRSSVDSGADLGWGSSRPG